MNHSLRCGECNSYYEDLATMAGCPNGCSKLRPKLSQREKAQIIIESKSIPKATRTKDRQFKIGSKTYRRVSSGTARHYELLTSPRKPKRNEGRLERLRGMLADCIIAHVPGQRRMFGIFKEVSDA